MRTLMAGMLARPFHFVSISGLSTETDTVAFCAGLAKKTAPKLRGSLR